MTTTQGDGIAAAVRVDGPAVMLEALGKTYGATTALSGVDLRLEHGEIHALVGQNGAGKSTCLGMIAGRVTPSTGHITVCGTRYPGNRSPQVARAAGVAAIYQELTVIGELSAVENAFLGRLPRRLGLTDLPAARTRFLRECDRLGVRIDPDARAKDLSVADQQMVEIIRALMLDSKVLLLDEPTASLSPRERAGLFAVLRDLRDQGVCLVLVSHYLDEVLAVADTVTVFRDGRLVATGPTHDWTEETLIDSMLGRRADTLEHLSTRRASTQDRPAAIRAEGLTSGHVTVDLTCRPGEIVGIAGLVGSGRSTVLRMLAGAQPARGGRLWLDGTEVPLPREPRAAWKRRVSLLPEDRKTSGVFMSLSGRENIVMGNLAGVGRNLMIDRGHVARRTTELAEEYGLPLSMLDKPAGQLSGGNQQKLLLARWGFRSPRVLLADEPTRGIDVGARAQVLMTLRRLADDGLAILLVSSDLEEVAAASDRVYVLHHGQVSAELTSTPDRPLTQDDLLAPAFGLTG